MKTRKSNRITVFTLLVVIITVIALIATSGTYAKYTSSISTNSAAEIARWSVKANDIDITGTAATTFDFDIFDTIYDSDFMSIETDVVQPEAENSTLRIAPGTSGYKELKIDNLSDVNLMLSIDFEKDVDSLDVPLQFALANSYSGVPSNFYNATDFATYLAGQMPNPINPSQYLDPNARVDSGESETFTLYWQWPYDRNPANSNSADSEDTGIGIAAADSSIITNSTYNVSITITATQVD